MYTLYTYIDEDIGHVIHTGEREREDRYGVLSTNIAWANVTPVFRRATPPAADRLARVQT